jgi:acetyltransferase-like isoleucine patch superfamily enzyme
MIGCMPIADSVTLEEGVVIFHRDLVNLYGCHVGAGTKIGAFVEIQKGASIGRRCKVSSHTFVCEGVTIEDDVFVGHGVMFINDPYPRATGGRQAADRSRPGTWCLDARVPRRVDRTARRFWVVSTIGERGAVGAGAVVTRVCARRCHRGRGAGRASGQERARDG